MSCDAVTDPDSIWNFCPSFSASAAFTALFAIITLAHIGQAVFYKKAYSWVIVFSGAVQTVTYLFRDLSIKKVDNTGFYSAWFILIMIAPIFTNAFAYMVQGRMTYNFTDSAIVLKVPAWRFSNIFVSLDIVAFIIQIAGAAIAAQNQVNGNPEDAIKGIHIYMGGIAFQQLCILLFFGLAIGLHVQLLKQPPSPMRKRAVLLQYMQYAVVLLITGRIIFRLIEYSDGLDSTIPDTEWYQYVFDSTLMAVALVIYNIFHPGRLMPGRESDLPSSKERKALKREGMPIRGRASQIKQEFDASSTGGSPQRGDVELGYRNTDGRAW